MTGLLSLIAVAAAAGHAYPAQVVQAGDGPGAGNDGDAPTEPVVYDGSAGGLAVPSPWTADPGIAVDGELDEAAWADAPILTGFTQFDPVEGVAATQRTEARILVTDDALYFGISAYDDVPGGPRATLSERDSFARSDDYVRLVLDTFDDRRRGYVVMVNPYGVQQDGLWVVGGGGGRGRRFGPPIDWNPDFVWDSGGRLHEWGYSVEVKLPFKSIRFREVPVQDWGLQVERRIARNGYSQSWAPVTRNVANRMEQFGKLTGLRDLDPGLFLEVNPVQTLSKQGRWDDELGALRRGGTAGDFGVNLTYGITSNLTLDGTYNPDFSQVEADAGQIAVNERFALFLQEKRPFFLEGTEIFRLPRQLVYTRSIVNPVAGAKLTGKLGSFNAGYLGAVDAVADSDAPDGTANPVVNLFRLRRDVGSASNIGVVYTDRTRDRRRYNRVAGLDGRFQITPRYTLTLLAAGSRTAEGEAGATGGGLLSAQLNRSGRNFQLGATVNDVSNGFRAGSGFIRRSGAAQVQSRASYDFRGRPGELIERWGPSLEFDGFWDHDDFWAMRRVEEASVRLGGSVSFRGNVTLWGNYGLSFYDFGRAEYEGLTVAGRGGPGEAFFPNQSIFRGLQSGTLFLWLNAFDQARGNIRATRSETPLFDFRTGTPVDVADSWSGQISLDLFPTTHLRAELGVRHTELKRKRDGSLYSRATIPRVRLQYQFSRSLFLRGIAEYASQRRGRLLTPGEGRPLAYCSSDSCSALEGSEAHDFSVEALLSYEPTPGTLFFVGYSRQMADMERLRFRDMRSEADGLFVKMSYRFRR